MRAGRGSVLVVRRIEDYAENMKKISQVLLLTLFFPLLAGADIYRWKDADGNLIFSDTPRDGAEKIEIGEIMTVPTRQARSVSDSGAEKPKVEKYDSVTITSPADEQTFRNNDATNVRVSVSLSPPLQVRRGHKLQLLVDGQSAAEPGRSLNFSLPEIERGAHQLQAVVVDPDGNTVERSPVSKFFVHKTSVANRAP